MDDLNPIALYKPYSSFLFQDMAMKLRGLTGTVFTMPAAEMSEKIHALVEAGLSGRTLLPSSDAALYVSHMADRAVALGVENADSPAVYLELADQQKDLYEPLATYVVTMSQYYQKIDMLLSSSILADASSTVARAGEQLNGAKYIVQQGGKVDVFNWGILDDPTINHGVLSFANTELNILEPDAPVVRHFYTVAIAAAPRDLIITAPTADEREAMFGVLLGLGIEDLDLNRAMLMLAGAGFLRNELETFDKRRQDPNLLIRDVNQFSADLSMLSKIKDGLAEHDGDEDLKRRVAECFRGVMCIMSAIAVLRELDYAKTMIFVVNKTDMGSVEVVVNGDLLNAFESLGHTAADLLTAGLYISETDTRRPTYGYDLDWVQSHFGAIMEQAPDLESDRNERAEAAFRQEGYRVMERHIRDTVKSYMSVGKKSDADGSIDAAVGRLVSSTANPDFDVTTELAMLLAKIVDNNDLAGILSTMREAIAAQDPYPKDTAMMTSFVHHLMNDFTVPEGRAA